MILDVLVGLRYAGLRLCNNCQPGRPGVGVLGVSGVVIPAAVWVLAGGAAAAVGVGVGSRVWVRKTGAVGPDDWGLAISRKCGVAVGASQGG